MSQHSRHSFFGGSGLKFGLFSYIVYHFSVIGVFIMTHPRRHQITRIKSFNHGRNFLFFSLRARMLRDRILSTKILRFATCDGNRFRVHGGHYTTRPLNQCFIAGFLFMALAPPAACPSKHGTIFQHEPCSAFACVLSRAHIRIKVGPSS